VCKEGALFLVGGKAGHLSEDFIKKPLSFQPLLPLTVTFDALLAAFAADA